MRDRIINYVRSGHPGLYIVSPEETRVAGVFKAVAEALEYQLYAWSATEGLVDTRDGSVRPANDPFEAITTVAELPENSLVLLQDFHLFLDDANPVLIRAIKDELAAAKTRGKCLVFVGCRQVLPPELERELTVIHVDLPDPQQLGTVLDGICNSASQEAPESEARDRLLDAASGMTCLEAENAFALSVVEQHELDPEVVAREKAHTVKKNGLLEVLEVREGLEEIGGLDRLKAWLLKRKDAFSSRAVDYGLPSPKGLLILGIPGTGKTLTAKATARVFGRPLLKLDAGQLFGSLVGQSEANIRSVIQTAEAIAPCVLLVDELEKAFSGSKSSGASDGGTSSRVFGSFISWLQDRTAPVFVVATANDVTQLPPELLRKGRFDELMFVDLPNAEERRAVWRIQIEKYGRDPEAYDLNALTRATEGFTGAEVEQAFIDGLYEAFARDAEPSTLSLAQVVGETVPLSRLVADQIRGLRDWAQGRARPASSPDDTQRERKIVA